MTWSRRFGIAVALVLVTAAPAWGQTAGDTLGGGKGGGAALAPEAPAEIDERPVHFVHGASCVTPAPNLALVRLPADSTVLWPGQWEALDASLRAAQTVETRLSAENRSLRASAEHGPGWGVLAAVAAGVAAGFAAGAFVTSR